VPVSEMNGYGDEILISVLCPYFFII